MTVVDATGRAGTVVGEESSPESGRQVVIACDDGSEYRVSPEELISIGDRQFRIAGTFDETRTIAAAAASAASSTEPATVTIDGAATVEAPRSSNDDTLSDADRIVIPVVEEQYRVRRQTVEKARVRISKWIEEKTEVIETPLMSEHVSVEHVAVNRIVDEAPAVRRDGDVTIIPVFEEVLVVEKKLLLREEIHVHWTRTEEVHREEVSLRSETVHIERVENDDSGATT